MQFSFIQHIYIIQMYKITNFRMFIGNPEVYDEVVDRQRDSFKFRIYK